MFVLINSIIEENTIGMALVFILLLGLASEKCMQYFRKPVKRIIIYVMIAFYYLSIIFKIVISVVRGTHG